jgi:SAM-dependent methyltransferase
MPASTKQRAMALARGLGVLPLLERAKFLSASAKAASSNRTYLRDHPDFVPPPLWWMHDMYSHASYELYMSSGRETAAGIASRIEAHFGFDQPRVADWGCGLGRVIRHLPARYRRYGFDYNTAAIEWCREHVEGPEFSVNGLRPPLPAESNGFEALYALSVFTHLSAEGHEKWLAEIARVLAPGGLFLGAFHASPREDQLLSSERARFEAGELVVRSGVAEGGRTFTAYHPEPYLRSALQPWFDIVEGPIPFFGQDLIIGRRR